MLWFRDDDGFFFFFGRVYENLKCNKYMIRKMESLRSFTRQLSLALMISKN